MDRDELAKRLNATFRVEAEEHLSALSSGVLQLEKAADPAHEVAVVDTVFREAHTLKGAARTVSQTSIEAVCQALESVFACWKRGEIRIAPELFDTLHHALDTIGTLLASPGDVPVAGMIEQLQALCHGEPSHAGVPAILPAPLSRGEGPGESGRAGEGEGPLAGEDAGLVSDGDIVVGSAPAEDSGAAALPGAGAETGTPEGGGVSPSYADGQSGSVRIARSKLDAVLRQCEEMVAAKLVLGQRAADLRETRNLAARWGKEWTRVYPEYRRMRQAMERDEDGAGSPQQPGVVSPSLLGFLEWNRSYVKLLESRLAALSRALDQDQRSVSATVDDLLADMKQVMMLPFSSILEPFPRMVRDLSRARGKEVDLEVVGGEVEIDRRILEETKDALIHLVRNSVDHGVEPPDERIRAGKPARGKVVISVAQVESSKVDVQVSDDGAGIDVEAVKRAAVRQQVLSAEDAGKLDSDQALSLAFWSEVTTSPIITELSGRGLGLAIVREKAEKLGGVVSVQTAAGSGASFRIVLPLTLATFRGILVRADDRAFAIPTVNVQRVLRAGPEEIRTVENVETIVLDGRTLLLADLGRVLQLPPIRVRREPPENSPDGPELIRALVLTVGTGQVAFRVDEVLDEQEVLVKSLGPQLSRVRNIAGAAVLGTGDVIPILNVADLIRSAARMAPGFPSAAAPPAAQHQPRPILVVEDSITSRMLLVSILDSAGYEVRTAVDGVDALTALKTDDFRLVVSDVEMPRMDGFDLTAQIRADKRLAELPVILVTTRGAREDQERGIQVGANAYIIKSSFDQENLLDVVRRLT